MKLDHLCQAPLNSTFMGVARGVLDYYRIATDDHMLFGLCGYAFAINIHPELCTSGPHCWDRRMTRDMLSPTGIDMHLLGAFGPDSSIEDRRRVETLVRRNLDGGEPCSMLNVEDQLIVGYDEGGFVLSQPWPQVDFPPKKLSFGNWKELGGDFHVEFYSFQSNSHRPDRCAILESLGFATRAWRSPKSLTSEPFGFGPDAYALWRKALQAGLGTSRGNNWNARVWGECRRHAAGYFHEVGRILRAPELCDELSQNYATVAQQLAIVGDKSRTAEEQIEALNRAEEAERGVINRLGPLIA